MGISHNHSNWSKVDNTPKSRIRILNETRPHEYITRKDSGIKIHSENVAIMKYMGFTQSRHCNSRFITVIHGCHSNNGSISFCISREEFSQNK